MFLWWGDNTAKARRASLSRGAHAGLTVIDPDPSVFQRAQTPATHHTRGLASLSPLSSLDGWMDGRMPRCRRVTPSARSSGGATYWLPAGGKRGGAVRGAEAEAGDFLHIC